MTFSLPFLSSLFLICDSANVGTGVRDFFYEPINGAVHGPRQFIEGELLALFFCPLVIDLSLSLICFGPLEQALRRALSP